MFGDWIVGLGITIGVLLGVVTSILMLFVLFEALRVLGLLRVMLKMRLGR